MPARAPPDAAERTARLRLSRAESVGPVTFHHLLARHGSAKAALEVLPDLARRSGRAAPLRIPSPAEIAKELEAGAKAGATLVVFGEPAFPPLLAALDPPPPVLWTVGSILLARRPCVAIVGARVASAGGQRFARQLAAEFGQAGVVVVSGLARGIDGAAHEGSLPTGTIAVLGGGVDDVYPPEHAALHRRIGEQGCLVSENAMGRRAKAQDFPRRNRIIAGLSLATVVVEAELRSGSLITARLANEQGREVFAVPGSPFDPRAKGPNDLIRKGAQMCESAADVIEVLREGGRLEEPQGDLFDPPPHPPPDLDDREAKVLRDRAPHCFPLRPRLATSWCARSAPRRQRCSRPWWNWRSRGAPNSCPAGSSAPSETAGAGAISSSVDGPPPRRPGSWKSLGRPRAPAPPPTPPAGPAPAACPRYIAARRRDPGAWSMREAKRRRRQPWRAPLMGSSFAYAI